MAELLALPFLIAAAALIAIAVRREFGAAARIALLSYATLSPLAALVLVLLGASWTDAAIMAALGGACLAIGEIDRRRQIIPDLLVLAVLLLAAISPFGDSLVMRVLGGLSLGLFFYAVRRGFSLAGRGDALGLGDVKFAAAIGAFLGPYWGLVAVALAGAGTIAAVLGVVRSAPAAIGAPFGIGLAAALCFVSAFRLWAAP